MKFALVLVVSALYACASGYQKQGFDGGYTSTQLDHNVFQVTYVGNANTSRERANDFALLRSAEITLENQYRYFVITQSKEYARESEYTTPRTTSTDFRAYTYPPAKGSPDAVRVESTYGTAASTSYGGERYTISEPRSSQTIVCYKEKPKEFSYNAEFIVQSLKKKYRLP